MTLVYAGIDEAGYGPMLGPLCVGLAVVRVRAWEPGSGVPDLWSMLARGVAPTGKDAADGRVPVADSKKLKLPNDGSRHPLTHLERGVLAFEACAGPDRGPAITDADLFERLGAALPDEPWWQGEPAPMPVAGGRDGLRIACNVLRRELDRAGVQVLDLRCRVIGVQEFNAIVEREGTKAAAPEEALIEHLAHAAVRWWPREEGTPVLRVACDRQSGRVDYTRALERAWGGDGMDCLGAAGVEVLEHSPRASRYAASGGRVGVQLVPEAEARHLPVALASMAAKLVRELAMARFNRYWSPRAAAAGVELKPTAGYVQDARRWLSDTQGVLTPRERAQLVRRA
jgi:hypothetical protein